MEFYPFDEEYVRRLCAGEPEVEEHFSLYFADRLRMKLRSRYAAKMDDIIQDTFLRALEKLRAGELRQAASLGAFVFSICKNICFEESRPPRKVESMTDELSQTLRNTDDPERDALDSERMRALRRAIEQMPPKDRRLLQAVLEGRSKDDICKEFGVSRDYLRVCLHRAKKALKRRYLQKFDDIFKPNDDDKKDH